MAAIRTARPMSLITIARRAPKASPMAPAKNPNTAVGTLAITTARAVKRAEFVVLYVTVARAMRVIGSPKRLTAWASQNTPKPEPFIGEGVARTGQGNRPRRSGHR